MEARDIVRSPAILEFAGISPAEYKEKDLQTGLVKHLSKFMLELGRGFALRALPPPEAGRHSAPRKAAKGGK